MPWLVWLYAIDSESDFILASVSAGQPPEFLSKEAGFEDAISSLDTSDVDTAFSTPKRKLDRISEKSDRACERLDKLMDIVESKVAQPNSNPIHSRLGMMKSINNSISECVEDNDLSPNTKAGLRAALVSEKKQLAKEIVDLSKNGYDKIN